MNRAPDLYLDLPPAFAFLLEPATFKVAYGGRGSGKSWSIARVLVALAYTRKLRILCVREYQSSISDSVLKLLADQIDDLGLSPWFDVQTKTIVCTLTGSEFIFKGLRRNIAEVKSTEKIGACWIEEGQSVSAESWQILIPTILRSPESQMFLSFNPVDARDPSYTRFVLDPPPGALVRKSTWRDNPAFPVKLDIERRYMMNADPSAYDWIWEGAVRTLSDAVIFKGKFTVETFETPEAARFFHGADWGFSVDPTVLVRCYITDDVLYIDQEAYGHGVEIDAIPALFDQVPTARSWPIKADSARPETISFVRREGFAISAAAKWTGSVEDGIEHLRGFRRIVIHERCPRAAEEFRLYSYKVDPRNREVLPVVADKFNHCIAHGELVETNRGQVPIQDVLVGDMVLTRRGLRRVYSAGLTSSSREIWELKAGGRTLRATRDHEVYTFSRGLVRMDALRYSDMVYVRKDAAWQRSRYSGMAVKAGKGIQRLKDRLIATTSVGLSSLGIRSTYTGLFGKMRTALFRPAITSTTKTSIPATMLLRTWNAYLLQNTSYGIQSSRSCENGGSNTLRAFDRVPPLGTALLRGLRNISESAVCLMSALSQNLSLARNAARYSRLGRLETKTDSAQTLANLNPGEIAGSIMWTGYAEDAIKYSNAAAMPGNGFALASVSSLRNSGMRAPVYDLSVEGDPEFVASGIVVSNCIDSLRYALDGYIKSRGAGGVWAALAG